MREIDDDAHATKDCARCGGPAFYWRTAVVAMDPAVNTRPPAAVALHQPAWTCMHCGFIEPHERRARRAAAVLAERRRA